MQSYRIQLPENLNARFIFLYLLGVKFEQKLFLVAHTLNARLKCFSNDNKFPCFYITASRPASCSDDHIKAALLPTHRMGDGCVPLGISRQWHFHELSKMSEEQFGLSSDSAVMNYLVSLVKRGLAKDLERAVLRSITL
ncbi:hypothetical protein V6N13_090131 [Hibiscus sabdariffa]